MITSAAGVDLIKKFEGLRLASYLDSAGFNTIGYGHKIESNESELIGTITAERAEQILKNDLVYFESLVNNNIKVPLSQNKFDALVSYYYNTGGSDTLKKLINEGAPDESIKNWWVNHYTGYVDKKGFYNILPGLITRRLTEANYFFNTGVNYTALVVIILGFYLILK